MCQRGLHHFHQSVREYRAISHYFDTTKDIKEIAGYVCHLYYHKSNLSFSWLQIGFLCNSIFLGNVYLHYENILRISLIKPTYCKTSRTLKAPLPSLSLQFMTQILKHIKIIFCTAQSNSKTRITTYNLKYTSAGFQSITSSPSLPTLFSKINNSKIKTN